MLESDHLEESRNDACEECISAHRKSVQLREELQKRSLVTSGNKEVLVARLREALIDEGKKPDEFKFDGADEDNDISTGTFTIAKMMELLLSMSTEIKQQTKELKQQIKEQSERQTEELKHVKLEVADRLKNLNLLEIND
ncbi:hypothetical protein HELRODRAFT_177517 [Helobdella robusta]|uniref:SAP domain-containing protein n=1 Tax=Helobdella robusta TaxID=6412 RepID=T1FBU1_HELRO|nr:hypothetical protein HELRODRAFT_177517 [Helobdella robusta]ESN97875.1 hypothetical protein HELRODRAFT_177517 [Helobdella robusta]